jgi:hypothetical protein
VDAQNKTNKETPNITPSRMVTENLDFQAKLKEIDRELGLEHGEINESLEILLQGDPYFKFQIPKAGELSHENSNAGLETCEANGPQSFGHIVDSSGPQRPTKKANVSTWKRVSRNVMGPTSSTHQPILAQRREVRLLYLKRSRCEALRRQRQVKKLLLPMRFRYRRRLQCNLAGCHKLLILELSWAWEPTDSS